MTPKEKAKELVEKYKDYAYTNVFSFRIESNLYNAKVCSVIAVDEVLKQLTPIEKAPNNKDAFEYWNEVKQEIENL
jgi:hypothetical protein